MEKKVFENRTELDFNGRKKTTIVAGSLFDNLDEFHRNHFSIAS